MQSDQVQDKKITSCTELNIQNLEKNVIIRQMVWKFIQDKQWDQKVKSIKLNNKIGVCKLDFIDHESAKQFYEKFNFQAKIIQRPFNISFRLTANENEMKKYYIEGITEEAQRPIFLATKKIGVCKIYTNYGPGAQGRIRPAGIISFLRKQDLSEKQQNCLKEDLAKLGIKLFKYELKMNSECYITLTNFYKGDLNEKDEIIIEKAKQLIEKEIEPLVNEKFSQIIIKVKREQQTQPKRIQDVKVEAILQFLDFETTVDNFCLLREHFLSFPSVKPILVYGQEKNNSYFVLFTMGIIKHTQIISDKAFQNILLETFRLVNQNIVQVLIFPIRGTSHYGAKIYMKSEQDGKDFIVQYSEKRQYFVKYYKDKNRITFNKFVDKFKQAKIKRDQRNVRQIVRQARHNHRGRS